MGDLIRLAQNPPPIRPRLGSIRRALLHSRPLYFCFSLQTALGVVYNWRTLFRRPLRKGPQGGGALSGVSGYGPSREKPSRAILGPRVVSLVPQALIFPKVEEAWVAGRKVSHDHILWTVCPTPSSSLLFDHCPPSSPSLFTRTAISHWNRR